MGGRSMLIVLLGIACCLAGPIPEENSVVDKRQLGDPPVVFNPFANPYAFYPSSGIGIKPLRPVLPPGFFMNLFATTPAPVDPMASFFKAKKDEFLNKLFNDISIATEESPIAVRSVVELTPDPDAVLPDDTTPTPSPTPKIDPSVFISKKFDFLAALFKSLNTTTIAPPTADPADPTATTVKPTIVPPGFWAPFPKPPKPPKATKPPKPEKAKTLLLNAIDEGLLKSILAEVDPASPALQTRQAPVSFLDKFLHRDHPSEPKSKPKAPKTFRLTDAPPTETPADTPLEARSLLFPPGYWIPPYIYAAKMGIYLDKIFETIDQAATADDKSDPAKRSVADTSDASSLILSELSALKNEMAKAYLDGLASAPKVAKPTPKTAKKVFWGPKTTPVPDPAQQKVELLSDVFDKLAEVQMELFGGNATTESGVVTTALPTPDYWAPDPTAADIAEYYKTKTQEFLSNIFASKLVPTPAADEK